MNGSLSLTAALLATTALAAGALVPFQAGSNAALGRALGHPLWATVGSLLISLLVIVPALLAARPPLPALSQAAALPLWAWLGGVAGVVYITCALLLTPRLGATGFIACVIAGQMLSSLLIDHFGLMGLAVKEANVGRLAGIVVMFVGVLLVQWFTVSAPPAG
ncbi:DMT family transporter [Pseudomonas sp. LJDD11]|uniref:DMT family transporter n=1 Tax=Pseudomonas sp. LJDD11 TaxID=2931984 RepID=UPI00211BF6B7|nr:DMT family transporter [Pseudomonas sp. LJDD11]MCQ9423406.1 DMT family transporter [Pseudomonas sp. LJDD11]